MKARHWIRRFFLVLPWVLFAGLSCRAFGEEAIDIGKIPTDLTTPKVERGAPSPGKRVSQQLEKYAGTELFHALYLPTDWEAGKQYPVIVEYTGNRYQSSQGSVEESDLGYGISGGKGFIWLCLPYVNVDGTRNQPQWWGDVEATVNYCKHAVPQVCRDFGGDTDAVFLTGFSRGAIACNFIGLHDDEIAKLWCGFICHSHYDGVKKWGYEGSDRESAAVRLARLGDRPQFISHEKSVATTRKYLESAKPEGNFTFLDLPYSQHTDEWVLRDVPERKFLRDWVAGVMEGR